MVCIVHARREVLAMRKSLRSKKRGGVYCGIPYHSMGLSLPEGRHLPLPIASIGRTVKGVNHVNVPHNPVIKSV